VATVASLADGLKVVRVDARKATATAAVGKTRPFGVANADSLSALAGRVARTMPIAGGLG